MPSTTARSVSRRTALAGLGAGALGLVLATRGLGVAAQDATPTATPYPMTGHPIIGSWQFDNELNQPGIDLSVKIFDPDGSFVEAADLGDGTVGLGWWRATGERTAEAAFVGQSIVRQDVFAPDYVPAGTTFDPSAGMVIRRFFFDVDATGNTVTGTGTDYFRRPDGTKGVTLDYAGLGTRLVPVPTATIATPTS